MKETKQKKSWKVKGKKKVRKDQTIGKNTFLEWKFEEGNKVSIKVKQKQRFRQSSQGKTWGRNVGYKTTRNKKIEKGLWRRNNTWYYKRRNEIKKSKLENLYYGIWPRKSSSEKM